MRDWSPLPLDITYARFASKATMLRKSSESPSATWRRFQVLPRSLEKSMTPLEPLAHTVMWSAPFASTVFAAVMPRRLVSIPLVCTDQLTSSVPSDESVMARSSLLGADREVFAGAMQKIVTVAANVSVRKRIVAHSNILRRRRMRTAKRKAKETADPCLPTGRLTPASEPRTESRSPEKKG